MSPDVRVDHGRMLDVLGREGELLVSATRGVGPESWVAGASGRTVGETVRHVGDLCEDTLSWLGAAERTARRWEVADGDSFSGLTARVAERFAELLAEFGSRPPDERCATWWPEDRSVHFWLRRMVHAATVHRVDVQTAAQTAVTSIEDRVAKDGIDEVLRMWFGYRLRALGINGHRTWSVRVDAADRSWLVTADPYCAAVVVPSDDATAADGVIAGDASAVYLWLWGRLPDRAINAVGDHDAVAQMWGLLRLATQ